jgi:hypothetical protein
MYNAFRPCNAGFNYCFWTQTQTQFISPHLLDDLVVCERCAVAVQLAVAALVDELTHTLQVGVAPGDVGLNTLQQTKGGLGDLLCVCVWGGVTGANRGRRVSWHVCTH